MKVCSQHPGKAIACTSAAILATAAFLVAGCTAANTALNGSTSNTVTTTVPVSLTDAPSDRVVAASLTLNAVVLTNSKGNTVSLLPAPLTFEAAHLDAVQEPLFTPAIPEDTYASITLTYSNAVVDYIDPTTKQLVIANATLSSNSQTFTFPTTVAVNNTRTSLLIDFLVAKSVTISGSTVTVTPAFHVAPIPVMAQPTSGLNGLQTGVRGRIAALGANQFTLVNAEGISIPVTVNTNTQYQGPGLTGFSNLAVNMLVEVDLETQADGSLLALRVEQEVAPNATAALLVGPVIAVTGAPATAYTQVVRQRIAPTAAASAIEKDTLTIDSNTKFQLPGRLLNMTGNGLPFTPTFNASTLFAGQVVATAANGISNNTATAISITLASQTVGGTIASALTPTCLACWGTVHLTLPSDSWLATLTGQTAITVYVPPGMQALTSASPVAGNIVRFNGYLFNDNGGLALIALVQGPAPGTPIGPTP